MSERLLVAVWRAPGVTLASCRDQIRGEWATEALITEGLVELTVSFADDDQGPYTWEPDAMGLVPTVDALLAVSLERAHDLDDIPARDVLHPFCRRVEAWRVDVDEPKQWERTWPDGETAPGIKMVSLMRRADGLTRQQFIRHWTEVHAALAVEHHAGLWNYRQNLVRRAYTPGGGQIDGIAELQFRSREDFDEKMFDDEEGRRAIVADMKKFMGPPGPETALMVELPLRTAG